MAAALFNAAADSSKAQAVSAGTEPGARVHPEVVETMKELGIDLSALVNDLLKKDIAIIETGK